MVLRVSSLVALVVVALARPAQAADDRTLEADRRFTEARALVDAGKYAAACPLYARSLELDPAIGTEFNLADCQEHVGQLASAWRHFRDVESTAHRVGKADREASAKQRADALEAKLGRIVVTMPAGVAAESVTLDGAPLERLDLETPGGARAEPGAHVIAVTAEGRPRWSAPVTVRAQAVATVRAYPPAAPAAPPPAPSRTQRHVALGLGVLGVAGLAVGSAAGIVSLVNHGSASDQCAVPTACGSRDGVAAWDRATAAGTVSTIGFAVGAAAVAAATVLWLTAPRARARSARVDLQGVHF